MFPPRLLGCSCSRATWVHRTMTHTLHLTCAICCVPSQVQYEHRASVQFDRLAVINAVIEPISQVSPGPSLAVVNAMDHITQLHRTFRCLVTSCCLLPLCEGMLCMCVRDMMQSLINRSGKQVKSHVAVGCMRACQVMQVSICY